MVRQTVHRWQAGYQADGFSGLVDRSHAPKAHPWRISADIEAVICELRRARRWGERRLVFELDRCGYPAVSRLTVYRVLVRYQLIESVPCRRRRDRYVRWERQVAMDLWQLDVTASMFLADGRECKIITGIDDHSRFCLNATDATWPPRRHTLRQARLHPAIRGGLRRGGRTGQPGSRPRHWIFGLTLSDEEGQG